MNIVPKRPYCAFNFVVALGPGQAAELAGFSEVSGLDAEVAGGDYRTGHDRTDAVPKPPRNHKAGTVILRGGLIGAKNLYEWMEKSRAGKISEARRDIVVRLQSENRAGTVMIWKLRGAIPVRWTGPTLAGKGGDVAIEELVLAVDTIEPE